MPDLALNVTTGQVLDARELAATQNGIDDDWICPDSNCAVRMQKLGTGFLRRVFRVGATVFLSQLKPFFTQRGQRPQQHKPLRLT